jgi:hypothetical protein
MVDVALRRGLAWLLAALVLAWCGWASGFRPGTRAGQYAWLVSLFAVLVADLAVYLGRSEHRLGWCIEADQPPWPRPGRGGAGPALVGTAPWLALGVVVLAWEVLGLDTGPHEPHLTISALTLAFRPVRAAMLAVWMGVGVYFAVARARSPASPTPPPTHGGKAGTSPGASGAGLALGSGRLARHLVPPLALLEGRSRAVGVAFWIGVLVCAAGIDLVARRSEGRIATFEELLRFISRPVGVRVLLVVAWTYVGWHLFAH